MMFQHTCLCSNHVNSFFISLADILSVDSSHIWPDMCWITILHIQRMYAISVNDCYDRKCQQSRLFLIDNSISYASIEDVMPLVIYY